MKRILTLVLSLALIFVFAACGEKNISSDNNSGSGSSATEVDGFVPPENYASVLLVTINPQFKIYLDEKGTVLAVDGVNTDAEKIVNDLTVADQGFEVVIEKIVKKANEKGFIKENSTINFEITENKKSDTNVTDILNKAISAAKQTADSLELTITVNAKNSSEQTNTTINSDISDTGNSNDTGNQNVEQNNNSNSSKTETVDTPNSEKPAHTHKFSPATCTSPKKCACGVTEGSAQGHRYANGTCSVCGAKDPNYTVSYSGITTKKGSWTTRYINNNTLYDVSFSLYGTSADYGVGVGYGDPFSGLPEDFQADIRAEGGDSYVIFGGAEYYIGRGDGDSLAAVLESNGTVTITDGAGNKLVLTRTAENTMKVKSSPDVFAVFDKIPVGTELKFTAE